MENKCTIKELREAIETLIKIRYEGTPRMDAIGNFNKEYKNLSERIEELQIELVKRCKEE